MSETQHVDVEDIESRIEAIDQTIAHLQDEKQKLEQARDERATQNAVDCERQAAEAATGVSIGDVVRVTYADETVQDYLIWDVEQNPNREGGYEFVFILDGVDGEGVFENLIHENDEWGVDFSADVANVEVIDEGDSQ